MKSSQRHFKLKKFVIMMMAFAIVFTTIGLNSVPVNAEGSTPGITGTVTALVPSTTSVDYGSMLYFDLGINAQVDGTTKTYFKAGDKFSFDTNLGELFDIYGGSYTTDIEYDETGIIVASLSIAPTKVTIEWKAAAADYRMSNINFSIRTPLILVAKNLNNTLTPATKTFSIGTDSAGSKNITWVANNFTLTTASVSGNGTMTPTDSVNLNGDSDSRDFTLTPAAGESVKGITLTRGDGTAVDLFATHSELTAGGTLTISHDDLIIGKNILKVEFTGPTAPYQFSNQYLQKQYWGSDYDGFYARMWCILNGNAINNLYANNGTMGASFQYSKLIFEEVMPIGARVVINSVKAPLFAATPTGTDSYKPTFSGNQEWTSSYLGMVDIFGRMTEVKQKSGETYEAYKARLADSTAYTYGVYVDPDTTQQTLVINFGATGDKNVADGITYSQLYGTKVTGDPILNKIVGDGNNVGGKLQAFYVDIYQGHAGDFNSHSLGNSTQRLSNKQKYSQIYYSGEDPAYLSFTRLDGTSDRIASNPGNYTVNASYSRAVRSAGKVDVFKYDARTGNPINGAKFKIQKLNASDEWEDYHYATSTDLAIITTTGTGDDAGVASSPNTETLPAGTYRLVEIDPEGGSPAADFDITTATYHSGTGSVTVNADGSFTMPASGNGVLALVSNSKTATVTYNANGGTGTLVDSTKYTEGSSWTVMSPDGSISKPGYYFSKWTDDAAGEGTTYKVGSAHTMNPAANVTLYAQWVEKASIEIESPDLKKTISNATYADENDETFDFVVTSSALNPAIPTNLTTEASITMTAGSTSKVVSKAFGSDIGFSKPGTYTFAISEKTGSAENYTYATNQHIWEVVIAESSTGYTVTSNKLDGTTSLLANFTNTYTCPVYTVTYDPNGGTGSVTDSTSYAKDMNFTVKSGSSMSRTGYTFSGWNTAADGSGTSMAAGSTQTMGTANVVLYAQWTANTPVDPDPTPVDPNPTPVDPDPTPVDPDPTPVDPDPTPVDPDPTPVDPDPTPVNPDPTPVDPDPTPVNPDPTPVNPEPTPVEPGKTEPTPVEPGKTDPIVVPDVPAIITPNDGGNDNPGTPGNTDNPTTTPDNPVEEKPGNEPETPVVTPEEPGKTDPKPATPGKTEPTTKPGNNKGDGKGDDMFDIGDDETPLGGWLGDGDSWALVNLLLAIVAVISSIAAAVIRRRKHEDNEQNNKWFIASVAIAVASVVLFVLTENLRADMSMVDKFSIWQGLVAAASVATSWKSVEKKTEEEKTEE